MTDQLGIIYVPVSELEEWPGNARVGDVERIKNSMKAHGVFNPLIVQKSTNRVMIGNHRLAALRELHDEDPATWDGTAPVAYYDVDDTQGTKINLIDNKLSDDAVMNDEALVAQLQAIQEEDGDLSGTGFVTEELDALLKNINETEWDDALGELPQGDPETFTRTFTLTARQAVIVDATIENAKNNIADIEGHSNGCALTYICEMGK